MHFFTKLLLLSMLLALAAAADGMMVYAAKMFLEPKPAPVTVAVVAAPLASPGPQTAPSAETPPATVAAEKAVPAGTSTADTTESSQPSGDRKDSSPPPKEQQDRPALAPSEKAPMKVIGNRDSKRYHLQGMKFYDKVRAYHRVEFKSEEEAVAAGYRKSSR